MGALQGGPGGPILDGWATMHLAHPIMGLYRVVQKVRHYQTIKKSCLIVLQPVNEVRFIRQIKV